MPLTWLGYRPLTEECRPRRRSKLGHSHTHHTTPALNRLLNTPRVFIERSEASLYKRENRQSLFSRYAREPHSWLCAALRGVCCVRRERALGPSPESRTAAAWGPLF